MRMVLSGYIPGQMESQWLFDLARERRARRPPAALSEPYSPVVIYDRTRRALPPAVPVARRELDAALATVRVTADRRAAIALLVSEATTNAVLHAYREVRPGPVRVRAVAGGGDLLLTVSDMGKGPERRTDSPGLGVGLDVMRASCDRMTVSPASAMGGTLVRAVLRGAVPLSDAEVRFARAGSVCTASARLRGESDTLRGASRALRDDRSALLADNLAAMEDAGLAVTRSQRLRSDLAA
jgi:anti-sigma regulatory factor (Ser/Thr protein kinase)